MKCSAIILAGGSSSRIGEEKGLIQLKGKPLIQHILNNTKGIVEETLVVVHTKIQHEKYSKIVGSKARVVTDRLDTNSPLIGALAGLESVDAEYSLLLSCDTPFLSEKVLALLLELCIGKNAAIPRWPNCQIEPLQSAYCTKSALSAASNSLSKGNLRLQGMIDRLRGVRYISTLVLEQIDPGLKTFFNVNTPIDLKRAESFLKG